MSSGGQRRATDASRLAARAGISQQLFTRRPGVPSRVQAVGWPLLSDPQPSLLSLGTPDALLPWMMGTENALRNPTRSHWPL